MNRIIGVLAAAIWAANLWWPGEIFSAVADVSSACAFGALALAALKPRILPPASALFWGALALLAAGLAGANGWDPYRSAESLLLLASGLALCLAVRLTACGDCRVKATRLFLIMAGLLCVYGLYQYFVRFAEIVLSPEMDRAFPGGSFVGAAGRVAAGRVFSRFALPSTFACVLLAALPFVFDQLTVSARDRAWIKQSAMWALAALILINLYLTKSYAAILILVVYVSLCLLRRCAPRCGLIIAVAVGVALAAALTLRSDMLGDLNHPMNPIRLRWLNWQAALLAFADSPWLGIGPGNYALAFAQYTTGEGWTRFAHSVVFRALCESGIFGSTVILAGLTGISVWLYRNRSPFSAALGLILAYSLIDIVFEFHSLLFTFFILLGLAPAVVEETRPAPPVLRPALIAFAVFGLIFSLIVMAANGRALQDASSFLNLAEADRRFQRASALWSHPKFDQNRAAVAQARGDLAAAADHLREAVRKSPRNVEYLADLGHVLVMKGDTEAARGVFSEALSLDPRRRHRIPEQGEAQ